MELYNFMSQVTVTAYQNLCTELASCFFFIVEDLGINKIFTLLKTWELTRSLYCRKFIKIYHIFYTHIHTFSSQSLINV